jgi:hypothetical protein
VDCIDNTEALWGAIVILWVVGSWIYKIYKRLSEGQKQQPAELPVSDFELADDAYGEDEYGDAALGLAKTSPETPSAPAQARADPWAEMRTRLDAKLSQLRRRSTEMAGSLMHERANRRFIDVPRTYVPGVLREARDALVEASAGDLEHPEVVEQELGHIQMLLANAEWVLDVIEYLAGQRRDPRMAAALGDADRLADACYRPILTFAEAEGLAITTNHPAVALSPFDLQIWTGLIPTSVAPIFLPADFFGRVAWWPSLGHEIGHDFYNSLEGFDAALRADLGLPSQEEAVRILRSPDHGLELNEIEGLFGAWIEEIFCDVFDTMMTGPASVATVIDLFSAQHDPASVASVYVVRNGRTQYGPHPPWHLRMLICTSVLSEMGLHREAVALREEWDALHQFEDGGVDFLVLPTLSGQVVLPIEPFEQQARKLAQRLYRGPLGALRGRGLRAISGLDYGTHRHQESLRARDAFLRGMPPQARDPRAVIAGAVLAARAKPERENSILRLARAAIPALGTSERWGQAAPPASVCGNPLAAPLVAEDLVAGVVLHEMLARRPLGGRTKSFI